MEINRFSTTNRLPVVVVDTKAFPSITALLLVGAGSRYENPENNGIAHFLEHMVFKGSRKYPQTIVLSSKIEGIGGEFNAFTGKDHTGYYIKAPTEHFVSVVDILADVIQFPLLKEEAISREKGVIIEEINMRADTPMVKIYDLYEKILYPKNPLGFDTIGSISTIKRIKRRDFIDYLTRFYHPENAVLVIAGGLNQLKGVKEVIEEKFGRWRRKKKPSFKKVTEGQKEAKVKVFYKKTEQAHFILAFRSFSLFDQRKYILLLLSVILGGGASSRLFNQLREKRGLCYYISSRTSLYQDVGNFYTRAGVAISQETVKQAIELILKEHKKISQGEVKKSELLRAKEYLKGQILLSLEDSFNTASFFGKKRLLADEIKTPSEVINEIEKVKLDQVISLAKEIFVSQRLNLSVIGPFEAEERFKEVLIL